MLFSLSPGSCPHRPEVHVTDADTKFGLMSVDEVGVWFVGTRTKAGVFGSWGHEPRRDTNQGSMCEPGRKARG